MKNVLKQSYGRLAGIGEGRRLYMEMFGIRLSFVFLSNDSEIKKKNNDALFIGLIYLFHIIIFFSASTRIKCALSFLSPASVSLNCWKVPDWLCWSLKSFNYPPNRLCVDSRSVSFLMPSWQCMQPSSWSWAESASLASESKTQDQVSTLWKPTLLQEPEQL